VTHIRTRFLQIFIVAACFCFASVAFGQSQSSKTPPSSTQNPAPVPKIDGGVGACTANFTVRDGENKPIYNAQISVQLRYGFMNMRKTDLQVGTDSNGKANFIGLPNFPKKPLAFHIKSGTVSKTITDDPNTNCVATYDVVLTVH
jgi:hypothetical protein